MKDLCFSVTETTQKCNQLGLELIEGRKGLCDSKLVSSEPNTMCFKWLMLSKFQAAAARKKKNCHGSLEEGDSQPHIRDFGTMLKNV